MIVSLRRLLDAYRASRSGLSVYDRQSADIHASMVPYFGDLEVEDD